MYNCAFTYGLSGLRLNHRNRTTNCAVGGEGFVSVLALFVSNYKWHSTIKIQLVIAAHGKYTLLKVQVCGSFNEVCYTEQYIVGMVLSDGNKLLCGGNNCTTL